MMGMEMMFKALGIDPAQIAGIAQSLAGEMAAIHNRLVAIENQLREIRAFLEEQHDAR